MQEKNNNRIGARERSSEIIDRVVCSRTCVELGADELEVERPADEVLDVVDGPGWPQAVQEPAHGDLDRRHRRHAHRRRRHGRRR